MNLGFQIPESLSALKCGESEVGKIDKPSAVPAIDNKQKSALSNVMLMLSKDDIDLGQLKSTLNTIEQEKRIAAARKRREMHALMRAHNAGARNRIDLQKSCSALQKMWLEENQRENYASVLRRSHEDDLVLRKVYFEANCHNR